MALILLAGGGAGSAPVTRGWLATWLAFLAPRLGEAALETANLLFRKAGHLLCYAVLGALDLRAVRGLGRPPGPRSALLAWAAASGWAVVDELHQSLYAVRGGTGVDVALDALGAAAGVGAYLWMRKADDATGSVGGRPDVCGQGPEE